MVVLSLGAGVQSSTMALMATNGDLDYKVDCAIFADTGWEPRKVYEYLDWLESVVSFPVHRVMHKQGLKNDLQGNGRFAAVPFFTERGGMGMRQCTGEYKILPIQKKCREILGYGKGQRIPPDAITMLIGISTDEVIRMKPSRVAWIKHVWPLIDKGMSRSHCLQYMQSNGHRMPEKSSCLGCPYHSDRQWLEIKNNNPQEWQETVEMDMIIRDRAQGMKQKQYMHKSCKPLDQVDFSAIEDQIDMFGNECEGMCGL